MFLLVLAAAMFRLSSATRSNQLALDKPDGYNKCSFVGPEGSGVKISFGVPSCNSCTQSLYSSKLRYDRFHLPFITKFHPVEIGQSYSHKDFCACNADGASKIIIEINKGQCTDNYEAKSLCWNIYKIAVGFWKANRWKRSSAYCVPCALDGFNEDGCNFTEVSVNVDASFVGMLQKKAAGDLETAHQLKRIRSLGAVTQTFEYHAAGWTACSKPCTNEAGPGTRQERYGCWQQGQEDHEADMRVCAHFLGPPPVRTETCNHHKCARFEYGPTDQWTECSKPCADKDGPGTHKRIYECLEHTFKPEEFTKSPKENCSAIEEPVEEQSCNTRPCTSWKARMVCEDASGNILADAACEAPKPSFPEGCEPRL